MTGATRPPLETPLLRGEGILSSAWQQYFLSLERSVDGNTEEAIDAKNLVSSVLSKIESFYSEIDIPRFRGLVLRSDTVGPTIEFQTHRTTTNPDFATSFIQENEQGQIWVQADRVGIGEPVPIRTLEVNGGAAAQYWEAERSASTDGDDPLLGLEDLDNSVRWIFFAQASAGGRLHIRETSNSSADRLIIEEGSGKMKLEPDAIGGIEIATLSGSVGVFGATPVTQQAGLTAQDTAIVDTTYGSEEAGVIQNNRTRIADLESAFQAYGWLP